MNVRELATAIEVTERIADKVKGVLHVSLADGYIPSVLLSSESFADESEGYTVEHYDTGSKEIPHGLSFKIGEVEFKSLLTEWEFKKHGWDDYLYPQVTDEVLTTSNLTGYEQKMKECGHKQSDFF